MAEQPNLEQRYNLYIRSLQEQNILDVSFNVLRTLKTEQNPHFLIEVINIYCMDTEKRINELTQHMNFPPVHFDILLAIIHKLRGSSLSIGGKQVVAACKTFKAACDDWDFERCVAALKILRESFNILYERLGRVSQFERAIFSESLK